MNHFTTNRSACCLFAGLALILLDHSSAFAPGVLLQGGFQASKRNPLALGLNKRSATRTAPKAQAEIVDGVATAFHTIQVAFPPLLQKHLFALVKNGQLCHTVLVDTL